MSVEVPVLKFTTSSSDESDIYPYGFASTSGELDGAILTLSKVLPYMLELAQMENRPSSLPRNRKNKKKG